MIAGGFGAIPNFLFNLMIAKVNSKQDLVEVIIVEQFVLDY